MVHLPRAVRRAVRDERLGAHSGANTSNFARRSRSDISILDPLSNLFGRRKARVSDKRAKRGGPASVAYAVACLLAACTPTSELPPVTNQGDIDRLFAPPPAPTPMPLPDLPDPEAERERLLRVLDRATPDDDTGVHDACLSFGARGDWAAVPHLIRALRAFGDEEPGPNVGIICSWGHCVNALERITGAKVGHSYSAWQHWYETEGAKRATPTRRRRVSR
jgi:hypothetical protein